MNMNIKLIKSTTSPVKGGKLRSNTKAKLCLVPQATELHYSDMGCWKGCGCRYVRDNGLCDGCSSRS